MVGSWLTAGKQVTGSLTLEESGFNGWLYRAYLATGDDLSRL